MGVAQPQALIAIVRVSHDCRSIKARRRKQGVQIPYQ
jgi:hypothetical protein